MDKFAKSCAYPSYYDSDYLPAFAFVIGGLVAEDLAYYPYYPYYYGPYYYGGNANVTNYYYNNYYTYPVYTNTFYPYYYHHYPLADTSIHGACARIVPEIV